MIATLCASRARPIARPTARTNARCRRVAVRASADREDARARRETLGWLVATSALTLAGRARADYGDTVYMDALAGKGKDYGKKEVLYPDFERTASGLQFKDMVAGTGETFAGDSGKTAVVDWDGYTIGYYGRPFEARNKSKGGAFTGETKDFFRFKADDADVIGAFREAIVGMKVGGIRRIIVPPNNEKLGYPDRNWRSKKPQPNNFSGDRALGFVLENQGMIDKTLLFDIELIKIL